jgi:hypothetical protein
MPRFRLNARVFGAGLLMAIAGCRSATQRPPTAAAQNPSPMVEYSRAHERLSARDAAGLRVALGEILSRPVELFIPRAATTAAAVPLLVHFLGASFIPIEAAARTDSTMVVATVNLTAGSAAYEQPFQHPSTWRRLLATVDSALTAQTGRSIRRGQTYLSAFSAGNGAVRAIIADSVDAAAIDGIVILDGIHTGYTPARIVVAAGGALDPANLQSLLRYARRAMQGNARMLVTHSEIFPGTFASTTETANWLIDQLGLTRRRTLEWGPLGMQQTSIAAQGRLTLLSFSGNSAPDHVDHLHALPWMLQMLLR